jgi:hypothetical protein
VLSPVLLHVGEEKQRYRVALSEVKAVMLLAEGAFLAHSFWNMR